MRGRLLTRSLRLLAVGVLLATSALTGSGVAAANPTSAAQPAGAKPAWTSLDTGGLHTCGTRGEGSLWCWGYGNYGALGMIPERDYPLRIAPARVGSDDDWATVSSGEFHTCGIRETGALWCWGRGKDAQIGDGSRHDRAAPVQVAPEVSTWTAVSSGIDHSCAVRGDQSLWCWGRNAAGAVGTGSLRTYVKRPARIGETGEWAEVSASAHTCAVKIDATLWCWGRNDHGQVGVAEPTEVRTPVEVGSGRAWQSVAVGERSSCAIAADGTLWCWGRGKDGQLGLGDPGDRAEPTQVGSSDLWADLDLGERHTCATRTDGTAWCWGLNASGRLGDGTRVDRLQPVRVDWADGVRAVATGGRHTCGLTMAGGARCWGSDDDGQLGTGRAETSTRPQVVSDQSGPWTASWSALDGSCGTTERGTLSCWGRLGRPVSGTTYAERGSGKSWSAVADGWRHVCGITADQALLCAGANTVGQLGDGSLDSRRRFREVDGAGTWTVVTSGGEHSCGIKVDQTLWCWGSSRWGQTGLGDTSSIATPAQVGTAHWVSVSAGYGHTCGVQEDGSAWCWGLNDSGQLGDGTTVDRTSPTPVSAGPWASVVASRGFPFFDSHSCGVATNGDVWCWGKGDDGQLGDGTFNQSLVPVKVHGGGDYTSVALGQRHTCGLRDDATMWCWGTGALGNGTLGQSGTPVRVAGDHAWIAVTSSAESSSCGITTAGDALCWGSTDQRVAPEPVLLHTVRQL